MQCPVCKDTTLVMSERQGIEIDYCPQCRGVWLDRGELDKIIQHSLGHMAAANAEPQAAAPQPGYPPRQQPQQQPYPQQQQPYQQQPYPQHDKYGDNRHYKRKKSFWEDLFD